MIPLNHAHGASSDLWGILGLMFIVVIVGIVWYIIASGLMPRAT